MVTRIVHRLGVWRWRVRYWLLDTDMGQRAHLLAYVLSLVLTVFLWARLGLHAGDLAENGGRQKAVYAWVVQLIIAIVSAIISYALQPKPEPPKVELPPAPTPEPPRPEPPRPEPPKSEPPKPEPVVTPEPPRPH